VDRSPSGLATTLRRIRPRRSWLRPRTLVPVVLAGLLVTALVLGLAGFTALRRPLPRHDGELRLAGLSAPVTVHRDRYGIPHVYAATMDDLFRAQGYLHAQDRFWEMDFRRHLTGGRLSELFGASQVETDAFLRTLGWRRVAEAEWQLISESARHALRVYAAGVNAWIAETGGPRATGGKSLEYAVLGLQRSGYRVAEWDPIDSLAWLKAMAWDLRGNMEAEIDRAALLAAGLNRIRIDSLFPAYPYARHQPIVTGGGVADGAFDPGVPPEPVRESEPGPGSGVTAAEIAAAAPAVTALRDALRRLPGAAAGAGAGIGSNSWVIGGDLTDTGSPILANDPHLAPAMPSIWYQIALHCSAPGCDYQAAGFSFSGAPGVIIGHNGRIAWGFTNMNPDVTDLYLERVDGDRYEVDGRLHDLVLRQETIKVAGGEDVTITVRESRHGPLLSDASEELRGIAANPPVAPDGDPAFLARPAEEGRYAISLAWTALTPGRTADALFALNMAGDWAEFRAAAALFEVPAQNIVYADGEGNIGYQSPGMIPVRGAGDGAWISPGWDTAYDWQGFVPFAELPSVLNPEAGYIVTANQAVIGGQYGHPLTPDPAYGYRSQRLHDLLGEAVSAGPITVDTVAGLQTDDRNTFAPVLVPALLEVRTEPLGRAEAAARDLLRGWDHHQPPDGDPGSPQARSAAASAYYNAVWRHLLALTFDELPPDHRPSGRDRWFEVVRGLLTAPLSPWWDRVATPTRETRDDVLRRALSDAYQELAAAQGDDPARWRWGRMHRLTVRNASFGSSGIGPVERMFNRGPVPVAGGSDLVNATGWDAAAGYEVTAVPSMRMIVDLFLLDESRWVNLTGNSGHAYHRNYDDQLELWRTGQLIPMRWVRFTIEREAADTLLLEP